MRLLLIGMIFISFNLKAVTNGEWLILNTHDEMTSTDHWTAVNNDEDTNTSLFIRCSRQSPNSPRIGISIGDFWNLTDRYSAVMIKLDDEEAYNEKWLHQTKSIALKMDSDKKIVKLLRKMAQAESIKIRVYPYEKGQLTSTFKLDGIKDVLAKIEYQCPSSKRYWK